MRLGLLLSFLFTLSMARVAWPSSADVCVNDQDRIKGAANLEINKSLERSEDPLVKAFKARRSDPRSRAGVGYCDIGYLVPVKKTRQSLEQLLGYLPNPPRIKKECIQASLQRDVGNEAHICQNGRRKVIQNSGKRAQCLNQNTVDYIHFAVNEALRCMGDQFEPIDTRFFLKKINNETAFNFYLGYVGGVGVGQLTSDPVRDIAGWVEPSGRYNRGNAKYILESLVHNSSDACAPFIETLKNDLKKRPPLPGNANNYCSWVSPGEGMTRNLIYSLGYYIHMRDTVIKPALAREAPALAENSDIVNYFTLVAYGPGGPAQAASLVNTLRLNSKTTVKTVRERLMKESDYIRQTENKMKELLAFLPVDKVTDADLRGDVCIE